jgi:hypothetical protein
MLRVATDKLSETAYTAKIIVKTKTSEEIKAYKMGTFLIITPSLNKWIN